MGFEEPKAGYMAVYLVVKGKTYGLSMKDTSSGFHGLLLALRRTYEGITGEDQPTRITEIK